MDPHPSVLIAYEAMDICNPVSPGLIDRALGVAGLPAGARGLDLGCGNAAMAVHLAETFGLAIDAIERSPKVFEIARRRTAGRGAPGKVVLHNIDSAAYLAKADPLDLIICAGASQILPNSNEPTAFLAVLADSLRPGGFLLWGDPYWKKAPDPQLAAMIAAYATYKSHAENIAAGEAAGLACWYAGVSTEQDWDDYSWRITAANLAWLDANPGHPDAAEVRQRTDFLRGAYLNLSREALGFGVYLFRRPL